MKILIPDYPGSQILEGIRSLSRNNYSVDLSWKLSKMVSFLRNSRYINNFHEMSTTSGNDWNLYSKEVLQLVINNKYDAVIPFGLDSSYALSRFSNLDKRIPTMLPKFENFKIANNKLLTAELANSCGLSTPRTFYNTKKDDLKNICKEANFPLVVKSCTGTGVLNGIRYVSSFDQLVKAWDELNTIGNRTPDDKSFPMVQEFIPGYIHDACTLSIYGQPKYILTQVRELTYPISGGPGAINITTDIPELKNIASKLIEGTNWHGPCQIEFIYDNRDKKFKLIEINPKLWGTLALSIKAGIDFPSLIALYLAGEKLPDNINYQKGYRYYFLFPQSLNALTQYFFYFGLPNLLNISKSQKFFSVGYDFSDPIPEFSRALHSILKLSNKIKLPKSSKIDKRLINKFPWLSRDYLL